MPYDEGAKELRVSLVMRHVTKHELRTANGGEKMLWEVRTRDTTGAWGKWTRVKAAEQDNDQPLGQTERPEDRRAQAATRLRRDRLQAMDAKVLRQLVAKAGLDTSGKKKKELIDDLLEHENN